MRINTNVASMTAQESASNVNKALNSSLEKLSSGLRINKASDDASGMAIADKLRTQASALGQSISNANSANALVQIADKGMAEQSNILDIVKTKLIQAATETTSAEGRESIRKDINKLLQQLDNISSQTNYNGINLLDKAGKSFTFQVGENKDYDIGVTTAYASNTSGLGVADGATQSTKTYEVNDTLANDQVLTLGSYSVTIDGTDVTTGNAIDKLVEQINGANSENEVENGYTASNVSGNLVLTNNLDGADASESFTDLDLVQSELGRTAITAGTGTTTAGTAASQATIVFEAFSAVQKGDTVELSIAQVGAATTFSFVADQDYTATALGEAIELALADESFYAATGSTREMTATATNGVLTFTAATGVSALTGTNSITYTVADEVSADETDVDGTGDSLASLKNISTLTTEEANNFMSVIDQALSEINTVRSDFGSTQNQLDSFTRNAMTTQTNIKAAESVIRDVDYAAESANFNKQNIIAQAGTYALSQANTIQQNVLRLLQ